MKTTIEVGGFEIKIEEMEGNISVSAMKEGEVVEEFELTAEDFESQDMGDDDMMSFGDEEMEEEGDFEGEEEGEEMDDDEEFGGEEMEEEEEEEESEGKLESFSHFVKKRKR